MPPFDSDLSLLLLWAVIGYGLGSIPFGIVLAKVMGLGNLRDIGSGNIGATNVLRTGNKTAAALTLLLDGAKGAVAVLLARAWPVGIACCVTWLAAAKLSRISSMGALVAAASSVIWVLLMGYGGLLILVVLLTALIFWRHRENIARINAGTEPKIGQKG